MSVLSKKEKQHYNYLLILFAILTIFFVGSRKIMEVSTSVFYDEKGNRLEVKEDPDYLRPEGGTNY